MSLSFSSIVSIYTQGKCSPFYAACIAGNVEVVKLLLSDNRIDVNRMDKVSE